MTGTRLLVGALVGTSLVVDPRVTFPSQVSHVQDHGYIDQKDGDADCIGPPDNLKNLERQVQGTRDQREPLCPHAFKPKPVCLRKPQTGIGDCPTGHEPKLAVGDLIGQIQKYLRIVRVWADVEPFEKALRNVPSVAMHQRQNPEASQENDQPLDEFYGRHSTQRPKLARMTVMLA